MPAEMMERAYEVTTPADTGAAKRVYTALNLVGGDGRCKPFFVPSSIWMGINYERRRD